MRHVLRDSLIAISVATLAVALSPGLARAAPIRVGTGSKGGDFHVLGNALAADFEARGGTVQLAVESTKGSCENIKRLLEGSLDVAMVQYDVAAEAYRASQMEPPKAEELEQFGGWMCKISPQLARQAELRLVAAVSDSAVHLLVRRPVRIDTIEQIGAQPIYIGKDGSGSFETARVILGAGGRGGDQLNLFSGSADSSTELTHTVGRLYSRRPA